VLTDEERALVAEHTRIGASILDPMKTFAPSYRSCAGITSGLTARYPDALAGEAIPLEARIVAIAIATTRSATMTICRRRGVVASARRGP